MLLSPQIPVQMTEQVTLDLVTVIELAPQLYSFTAECLKSLERLTHI